MTATPSDPTVTVTPVVVSRRTSGTVATATVTVTCPGLSAQVLMAWSAGTTRWAGVHSAHPSVTVDDATYLVFRAGERIEVAGTTPHAAHEAKVTGRVVEAFKAADAAFVAQVAAHPAVLAAARKDLAQANASAAAAARHAQMWQQIVEDLEAATTD